MPLDQPEGGIDPARKAQLAGVKLAGLVGAHTGDSVDAEVFGSGAGLVAGDIAWAYFPDATADAVGPGLIWATKQGAPQAAIIVDSVSDKLLAGLAGLSSDVSVYRADGTSLVELDGVRAAQPTLVVKNETTELLAAKGLDVVAGHGMWLGEVNGLEVARAVGDGGELQLGVGAYDRGAFEALYPGVSPAEAIDRVIELVTSHRSPGAPPHLMNRIARERWLRSDICAGRADVGLAVAVAAPGAEPRLGLHEVDSDYAVGPGADGELVLVVTTTGFDPNLLVNAASVAERDQVERIVICSVENDRFPVLEAALRWLDVPASWATISSPWQASS